MTEEQREELQQLSYYQPELHALLQLYEYRVRSASRTMSESDWYHYAIVTLVKALDVTRQQAIEALKRSPPAVLIMPKRDAP